MTHHYVQIKVIQYAFYYDFPMYKLIDKSKSGSQVFIGSWEVVRKDISPTTFSTGIV